jgi:hypothetical protein
LDTLKGTYLSATYYFIQLSRNPNFVLSILAFSILKIIIKSLILGKYACMDVEIQNLTVNF